MIDINQQTKQRMYLTAESIYRFLLELDDKLDTLILCKSSEVNLVTTDQSLYEALGSIEDKSKINFNKLVKFMEVTELLPFLQTMKKPRQILTDKRVAEIRALKKEASAAKDKSVEEAKDTQQDKK
ncbi:MAG: hypothetical protein KAS15_08940 [Nanoarchaeota archaeon]|nr:hypothetical protein [Nanoarchaeota archaeon]MCK5630152.1 hypothetical protein [Nanoarchaeota archaeon]